MCAIAGHTPAMLARHDKQKSAAGNSHEVITFLSGVAIDQTDYVFM
jgi:hypothetical protein